MGVQTKTVNIVTDDHDQTELPEDTKPVYLAFEDKAWSLYLSSQNEKTLRDFIADFTRNAETTQSKGKAPATRKRNLETYGYSPDEVREWGIANGVAKPQGRISQLAYTKYHAAQK